MVLLWDWLHHVLSYFEALHITIHVLESFCVLQLLLYVCLNMSPAVQHTEVQLWADANPSWRPMLVGHGGPCHLQAARARATLQMLCILTADIEGCRQIHSAGCGLFYIPCYELRAYGQRTFSRAGAHTTCDHKTCLLITSSTSSRYYCSSGWHTEITGFLVIMGYISSLHVLVFFTLCYTFVVFVYLWC